MTNCLRDLALLNAGITLTLTDMRKVDEAGNPRAGRSSIPAMDFANSYSILILTKNL